MDCYSHLDVFLDLVKYIDRRWDLTFLMLLIIPADSSMKDIPHCLHKLTFIFMWYAHDDFSYYMLRHTV